jgi:hypothetical protein
LTLCACSGIRRCFRLEEETIPWESKSATCRLQHLLVYIEQGELQHHGWIVLN